MQRRFDSGLIEDFLRRPQRFRFFQAMRLLDRWDWHVALTRGQERAQPVQRRFRNSTTLAFSPSEIESAQAYDHEGRPVPPERLSQAIAQGEIAVVEVVPAFMGLLGAQGALPHHYSERVISAESLKRHPGAKAFFDLFSDRLVALFYSGWKKYRLGLQHESRPRQAYLHVLLSLAGLEHASLRDRLVQDGCGDVSDEVLARYAGAIRQRPVSAPYLQQVLADYFRTPLRIEQFVGHWYRVPDQARTRLGQAGAVLGAAAYVGERIWQRNLRLRLWIGPLEADVFHDFLPGGQRAGALARLLTLLAGVTYEYEIRLILGRESIHPCALDGAGSARLGWSTFLISLASEQDRSDATYELHTIH